MPGNDEQPLEHAAPSPRPAGAPTAGRCPSPGKGRRSVGRAICHHCPSGSASARRPVSVWRAKRFSAKPGDAVRHQRPADRRGDRNEQLRLVDQPRGLGEQRGALGRRPRVARGVEQGRRLPRRRSAPRRSGTGAGTRPARSTARPASISLRSAGTRGRRRARPSMPERAPVGGQAVEQDVRARPVGQARCAAIGCSLGPNRRVALRRSARPGARRSASPIQPARLGRRRLRARPGAGSRAATRPGTPSAAISASRSIAWLSRRAHFGVGRAARRCAPGPARTGPATGSNRSASARQLAAPARAAGRRTSRRAPGRSCRRRSARRPAARLAPCSRTSSRRLSSSSEQPMSRVRRSRAVGAGARRASWNGPVPWPLRTIAELGLGEQLQQVGPRRRQPDLDHPVGHRDDLARPRRACP